MKNIVVIGAGFGGLSAAALLAKKGHKVIILEKNESAGGRASIFEEKGFRFDMGPSWYLMRDVFQHFFRQFDKTEEDFYSVQRLDPSYRIYFEKNRVCDIKVDLDENIRLFESFERGAGEKLKEYLKFSKEQYDTAKKLFLYKSYKSLLDFYHPDLKKQKFPLHIFQNMDSFSKRYFKSEELRKIIQYTIVFLGGTPKHTPALYSIMAHIDFNMGVWYPKGGIYSITRALVNLCTENNVEIIYNSPVKKIEVENSIATSVITEEKTYPCDLVVTNADYAFAETKLLEEKYQTYSKKYWEKKTIAPSAFIIYLGVSKKIPQLLHHNLLLVNDWVKHFETIFEKPSWPENPSYYICCPSKTDSTVAPPGSENLFILVPVAAGLTDTPEIREHYYKKIMDHLESEIKEDIRSSIVVKKIFAHTDFSQRYNAYKGTALGLSHTLLQSALFRPKHQSKKVKNLFYSGQYTHPGIGLPMTLISSHVVVEEIEKQL